MSAVFTYIPYTHPPHTMVSSSTALAVAKYLLGATVTGTALVTGGLWYYQRSLIYPAYLPDGSRTSKSVPISGARPS
jgi:hypothetical protein